MNLNSAHLKNLLLFIASLVVWLVLTQGFFYFIQKNQADSFSRSFQIQVRQELDSSNFHYLARSLTDLSQSKAIQCVVLKKASPDNIPIMDLQYSSPYCKDFDLWLNGSTQHTELKALNGDLYKLDFKTVNQSVFYISLWSIRLAGLVALILIFQIISLAKKNTQIQLKKHIELANLRSDLARKIAHDIRSPLSALNMLVARFGPERPENEVISEVVTRINSIANDLLDSNKKASIEISMAKAVGFHPNLELDKIIREKQLSYPAFSFHVSNSVPETKLQQILLNVPLGEWQRILSNLINNAVEASSSEKQVHISLSSNNSEFHIQIIDFGHGISEEVLSQIGKVEITTKKDMGHGIGLFHSYNLMNSWGGRIVVHSKINVGTQILLVFPLT